MKISFYCLLVSFILFSSPQNTWSKKKNTEYVNLFMGTSGDNGQVDPGAGIPFGMVRVCPDSDPRRHAGYDYSVSRISGISVNRLSGVGCGGAGGNLSMKPAQDDFELSIDKTTERAEPGFYQTKFNNGVIAKLTATNNMAVEQFLFPENSDAIVTINFGSSFERLLEEEHTILSDNQIEGSLVCANVCGRGKYKLYFHLQTNQSFKVQKEDGHKMTLSFTEGTKRKVEIRISLSSLSTDDAKEIHQQSSAHSFARIKKEAAGLWNKKLNRIDVKGGTADDRAIFYTSLYRCFLSPVNVTSSGGNYMGTDGKINHSEGIPYYSSWSLWDTYRTKFPLLALLEPKAMSHISRSLIRLYQTGKENWSTDFEATPTVRTEHAVILLLDAYKKGVEGIDFRQCYVQMCDEAAKLPLNSPDRKLEAVCDLWALAQISNILDEKDDALKYKKQADDLFEETWSREFMTIDERYAQMRDNGLYQGTRWQYRWAVPYYLDKMIDLSGHQDTLVSQLNTYFENHLHNHGNEPDIHVPFLFNRLGAPELTQQRVTGIIAEEITHKYGGNAELGTPYFGRAYKNSPVGYSPEMDEDDGTMSAWYVFSAMGIYPLLVGEAEYEVIAPLFDRVRIHLENGQTFTLEPKDRKQLKDNYKEIRLNGKMHPLNHISHQDILRGGTLEFIY